jgi:hypothetical protein
MMPYDLLWPVSTRLDAGIPEAKVVEEVGGVQKNGSSMFLWFSLAYKTDEFYSVALPILTDDTLESLQYYAMSLLDTVPDAKGKSRDIPRNEANEGWKIERDGELADEGGLTGCREAVELLTRNQRKGEG